MSIVSSPRGERRTCASPATRSFEHSGVLPRREDARGITSARTQTFDFVAPYLSPRGDSRCPSRLLLSSAVPQVEHGRPPFGVQVVGENFLSPRSFSPSSPEREFLQARCDGQSHLTAEKPPYRGREATRTPQHGRREEPEGPRSVEGWEQSQSVCEKFTHWRQPETRRPRRDEGTGAQESQLVKPSKHCCPDQQEARTPASCPRFSKTPRALRSTLLKGGRSAQLGADARARSANVA